MYFVVGNSLQHNIIGKVMKSLPPAQKNKYEDNSDFNWFRSTQSKFMYNKTLYSGYEEATAVVAKFSKSKVVKPIAKEILQAVKSLLKERELIIALEDDSGVNEESFIQPINEVLVNCYLKHQNTVLNAWEDFMSLGAGIIKVNEDATISRISPLNCVWELSEKDKTPTIFVEEKVVDTVTACEELDISPVNYSEILHREAKTKIIVEACDWYADELNYGKKDDQGRKVSKDSENIYSRKVNQKLVYTKPYQTNCIVRYEYSAGFSKDIDGNEVKPSYTKKIFLNSEFLREDIIPYQSFPYTIISERDASAPQRKQSYYCWFDMIKGDVITYNILKNSLLDFSIKSSAGGTLLIDKSKMIDGTNKNNITDFSVKSIVPISNIGDSRVSDVVSVIPSAPFPQGIEAHMLRIKEGLSKSLGLLDYDRSKQNSGYHEKLRMDKEMNSLNVWVTPIDIALKVIGKKMLTTILFILSRNTEALYSYSSDKDNLNNVAKLITSNVVSQLIDFIKIKPNKYTNSYNELILSNFERISTITGEAFKIDPIILAEHLGFDSKTIENIRASNSISKEQQEAQQLSLEKAREEVMGEKLKNEKLRAEIAKIFSEIEKTPSEITKNTTTSFKDYITTLEAVSDKKEVFGGKK